MISNNSNDKLRTDSIELTELHYEDDRISAEAIFTDELQNVFTGITFLGDAYINMFVSVSPSNGFEIELSSNDEEIEKKVNEFEFTTAEKSDLIYRFFNLAVKESRTYDELIQCLRSFDSLFPDCFSKYLRNTKE